MKILYAAEYYPFLASKVILEINKRLSTQGVSAKIITSNLFCDSKYSPKIPDYVSVERLRAKKVVAFGTSYVLYDPRDWFKIEQQYDIDLIHLHFLYGFLPLYIGMLKKINKLKIPIVATSHGLTTGYSSAIVQAISTLLSKLTKELVISEASLVTTISRLEYNYLSRFIPHHKLRYIPNGVDTTVFKPDITKRTEFRRKLGFKENDFVVLYFGNLRAAKGISTFLKAMFKIIPKTENIKFLIAGTGPQSYLVAEAERKNYNRIKSMLEYIADKDLPSLYNASDVYVLPSFVEGMPLSIMEAMACGKPVIATKIADVPSLVETGVNGILVQPDNSESLVEGTMYLAKNPELVRRMGEVNIEKMKKHDWNNTAKQYHTLYLRAIRD